MRSGLVSLSGAAYGSSQTAVAYPLGAIRRCSVPTRNTGFDHLRDGFVRSMQARFKLLSKQGLLSEEENEVRRLRFSFPSHLTARSDLSLLPHRSDS